MVHLSVICVRGFHGDNFTFLFTVWSTPSVKCSGVTRSVLTRPKMIIDQYDQLHLSRKTCIKRNCEQAFFILQQGRIIK